MLFGARPAMELSSIGDQVFAVESITKKRVRKVSRTDDMKHFTGDKTCVPVCLPGWNAMFSQLSSPQQN